VPEIETKLAVDSSFVLPALPDADPSILRMDELPSQNLRAVYYDSDDLRLARHGITLRHRSGDEEAAWTLKFPVEMGAVSVREELHFDGELSDVPEEARRLVTAYLRGSDLSPVARLRTKRRRWGLMGANGTVLAEVVDDEVSVLEGGDIVSRFREIEIEAISGDRGLIERLARVLHGAGAGAAEPIPKAVRALGARATAPPDLPPAPEPGPDDPASETVRASLINGASRIITNDPGVRAGDPEALHQMRVGARRLRSDLGTFKELVHAYWADDLVAELRWIAELLGEVRDIDVFKDNVEHTAEGLHDDLKPLYATLDERHAAAREALNAAMVGERYVALLDSLVAAANTPHVTDEADLSNAKALPPLVAKAWKKLSDRASKLKPTSTADDFHQARIRAKKLRYASEVVGPALGAKAKEAKDFAERVEQVQEVLGDHQDALVAIETINEIATAHGEDGALNLAAGRLIEREERKAKECRKSFFKVWAGVDSKKRRKWFET
jgi:CHAD domain-containing protein